MTGSDKVHFITIGRSKEHVQKCIDQLGISAMVVFTSSAMREEVNKFCAKCEGEGVKVLDIVEVDPFSPTAVDDIVRAALTAYAAHSGAGKVEIISGLTGGTNLMAVGMGLFSLIKGLPCHYVLDRAEDNILPIDVFVRMGELSSKTEMESFFLEGGR